jgi:hypothetical protein
MHFSEEVLRKLKDEHGQIEHKYHKLLLSYNALHLTNKRAREFAVHGFCRRLKLLARCIDNVFSILPPNRDGIPTASEISDVTINIQAFLVNVFGCIDNLAWIWVQEKGLTKEDGSPLPNNWIGLSPNNKLVRESFSPSFETYLKSLNPWFEGMVDFRHALAHRISPYIPPHTVRPADEAAYKVFEAQMEEATRAGNFSEYDRLEAEQLKLARFTPWIQHSFEEEARPIEFYPQLIVDFLTIEQLAWKMLDELKRLTGDRMARDDRRG